MSTPDWEEVGRRIREARLMIRPALSAREAARRAGMSTTYWQDLERGSRSDGGRHNPSDIKLADAALVVGLDPGPLFALVERVYTPVRTGPGPPPGAAALSGKIAQLKPSQIAAIEALVDEMLGPEDR